MTPQTNCCLKCEQFCRQVVEANTKEEKLQATDDFAAHIHAAQGECDLYKQLTVKAREKLQPHLPLVPGQQVASLKKQHYTFDFAQQLTLPCQSRQVGLLFFKVPYWVQMFGVCNEGLPRQINYLIAERDSIGENGSKSRGPNMVISCLHHYFQTHGLGKQACFLHVDNCAGQNKSKSLMTYLSWCTIVGLHDQITISFMVVGHTRCTMNGCFGMVRRKYRRSGCDSTEQLGMSFHGKLSATMHSWRGLIKDSSWSPSMYGILT